MADSTKIIMQTAVVTVLLTALGVILLWRTLRQRTRTLNEAKDATFAVRESNEIMRQEQRPWLEINREIECRFKFFPQAGRHIVEWRYKVSNRGKSPAFNVRVNHGLVRTSFGHDLSNEIQTILAQAADPKQQMYAYSIIYPGEHELRNRVRLGKTLEGDGEDIYLIVAISYEGAGIDGRGHEVRAFHISDVFDGKEEDFADNLHTGYLIEDSSLRSVE